MKCHITSSGSSLLNYPFTGVNCDELLCISLQDDVAYFSFPFNFELFYKNESLDEEEQGE